MSEVPNRPVVIGIFAERDRADRAVDDLRRSGFRDDQIGTAIHPGEASADASPADIRTSGFIASSRSIAEVTGYQREVEAGQALVAVKPEGAPTVDGSQFHEATDVLCRNGAYLIDNAL